jgi:VWFA-related protein
MASRFGVISVCLLAASLAAAGQDPQGVFRGGVQTVAIYATVTDATGRLVPNLEREHFEIYDDGKLVPMTVFRSDVQPVTVVVMLDTSGSMTLNIELVKQAAEQFVIRLLPDDHARIGSFSDNIRLSPLFTSDRDELIRLLHTDIQYGNPTYLWDALDVSMDALSHATGRRVVLIFTDGEDDKSVKMNFDQVLARAETEEFMIYAIGLHSVIPALGLSTKPDRHLRLLSDATGGGYFELLRTSDLNSTFTRVADELHRQYVLGFSPKVLDGRTHLLDVRVKVEGMTARTRKSYLAKSGSEVPPLDLARGALSSSKGGVPEDPR